MDEQELPILPPTRRHGLRPHLLTDGSQALWQALLVGDASAEELHRAGGGEYARHQHRRREHRLPHHRRAYLVPAAV